jgi:hypothetical protein
VAGGWGGGGWPRARLDRGLAQGVGERAWASGQSRSRLPAAVSWQLLSRGPRSQPPGQRRHGGAGAPAHRQLGAQHGLAEAQRLVHVDVRAASLEVGVRLHLRRGRPQSRASTWRAQAQRRGSRMRLRRARGSSGGGCSRGAAHLHLRQDARAAAVARQRRLQLYCVPVLDACGQRKGRSDAALARSSARLAPSWHPAALSRRRAGARCPRQAAGGRRRSRGCAAQRGAQARAGVHVPCRQAGRQAAAG